MLEAALWSAVRRLDERGALLRQLDDPDFERRAAEAEDQARVVRELIARRMGAA